MAKASYFFMIMTCLILLSTAPSAWAQEKFKLGSEGFDKVEEPSAESPEGKLQEVRKLIAAREGKEAAKVAKAWIKEHPNHPLLPEAYLLRADARVSYGKFYKALFDYEFLIRSYPDSSQFHVALERELTIADAFGRGVKRHLFGMQILPAQGEAEEIYIRIQERSPGSKIAERAGIALADFYYRRSEMFLAAQAYELFLRNYPNSQWREHAMKNQILANLATFKGPRFDATGLIEGQTKLKDYRDNFPAAAEQIGAEGLTTRIDESLATRSYLAAEWYEKRGKFVSARTMYKRVLSDHAGSRAAQQALGRLHIIDPNWSASVSDRPVTTRQNALPPVSVPTSGQLQREPINETREADIPRSAAPTDAPPVPGK